MSNKQSSSRRRGRSHSHDVKIGPAARRPKNRNRYKSACKSAEIRELELRSAYGIRSYGY
jgi:hypothetical protein